MLRNAATRSTIDQVTTLFAPVGGRTRATLSFRVGTADEPLHQRGINHLIGHLAGAAADQDGSTCHVTVSASTLSFHFSGNALAVANEIGAVCHWITTASTSPVDSRALQRARQAAADDERPHAPEHAVVLRARFGAAGWGAGAIAELGLQTISATDISAWVARYLNAANAVLALSGTKATTLRVPLPAGEYQPVGQLPRSLLSTPALMPVDVPRVSLSGLITTDPDHLDRERAVAGLTTEIIRSRIAFALRRRYGAALAVRGGPMALGVQAVQSVAWADITGEHEAKAADIAAEALEVLTTEQLVPGELAAQVRRRLTAYEKAAASQEGHHELLHRQALGALNQTPWSLALERRMLTNAAHEQVGAQLEQVAASTVLLMRPVEPPVRSWAGPGGPEPFVADGAVFRSRPAYGLSGRHRRPSRLIVDANGVTIRTLERPDEQLRWDSLALAQVWDDGRHLLTSTRAHTVDILPEHWLVPELATDAVATHLATVPTVRMGQRDTPPPAPERITDRITPAWWWVGAASGILLCVAAVIPMWDGSLVWLRWIIGSIGAIGMIVGGVWAYDTALTEHRLSRPGRSRAAPAQQTSSTSSVPGTNRSDDTLKTR